MNLKLSKFTSILPYIALASTLLMWASSFVGIRYALVYFTPSGLAAIRCVVAFIVLSVSSPQSTFKTPMTLIDALTFISFGALGIVGYHLGLNIGERSVPAATASFLVAQIPIATLIVHAIVQRQAPTFRALLGVLVGVTGTFIILRSGSTTIGFGVGVAFIIAAVFSESTYFALQPLAFRRFSIFQVNYYTTAAATLMLIPSLGDLFTNQGTPSVVPWLVAIYLGVFPAAVAYLFWSYAIEKLGVVSTASSLYALPLATLAFGYTAIGELPDAFTVVGGMIALCGAYLVYISQKNTLH